MTTDLLELLDKGPVICAEGYLFELERRGYLQAGSFVPEVALEHPDILQEVHRDFVNAGSDVVLAFTYNGHREKMRLIGKEDLLEPLNRSALNAAKKAAAEFEPNRPLVAGNLSNTNIFNPQDPKTEKQVREMFTEMVGWCADEGVDYVIGETFYYAKEAAIALDVIKEAGFRAVITLGVMAGGNLLDGYTPVDACRMLEDKGADVVGLNCFRGPGTMLDMAIDIRKHVNSHVAALPVTYRTTQQEPTFFNIQDRTRSAGPDHGRCFPDALEPLYCNRQEIADFAEKAFQSDIYYLGLCCGCNPAFLRSMAEAVGKETINSKYSPDISKHFLYGNDPALKRHITDKGSNA